ncbi:MAG TPA: ABC transporter permease [Thermoanaerobaculaceae bacterium]|nr:ABC transporter permease [Thermoanaerobaculaceae bacterium]HPS79782.1 ABC transporter permease [Thermoanaerobaculaceae bacterium]
MKPPESSAPSLVRHFLEAVGAKVMAACEEVGRFFYILYTTLHWMFRRPFDLKEWGRQMVRVGVDSLPVVGLTALFTGMVMALQTFRGFERFHAEGFVASVVSLSLVRELAPVLSALMMSGRIGSALAAELGTMRVTEQIDALYAMATEPIHYLVVPRVGACVIMLPPLVMCANGIGILGGWLVAVKLLGANPVVYWQRTFQFLDLNDIMSGLIKAAVFGLILSVTGCAKGYFTSGGAEGVGRATTAAVVMGSIVILLSDFFLTKILF